MAKKTQFASKIGLIAATVGSAIGLGNIWRFPAETQANGGAAFLVIYVICVVLLGTPVMVSEFALGRGGGSDAIGSFKHLHATKGWWTIGGVAILASYLILSFYMVVAGWTLEYLWDSLTGSLYDYGADVDQRNLFTTKMQTLTGSVWQPLYGTFAVILINLAILIIGVRKGIERISNILMPILFIILLVFTGVSLTLPNATEGVEFFLKPDFSKLTPKVVLNALGQAFFSLSLGMGILITYASYFPKDTKLVRTAFIVSFLDMLVAIMMGMIIFPAVTSFGLEGEGLKGATLVFVTLPEVFAQMPLTRIWSSLFFLLLSVAALTSTISMAEVSVSFCQNRFNMTRRKACATVLLPLLVLSAVCSLSQGPWSGYTILGMTIFDFLDTVATNIMLPLGSIGMCIYIGWFAPKGLLKKQLTNNGSIHSYLAATIMFIIRYAAPVLIACVLMSNFL